MNRARTARRTFAAFCVVTLAACSPAPPPAAERAAELPTVEVTAAPDAAYSIAGDEVERRANPAALSGALPDGFPADIPLYRPSSLVDFSARPEGGATVVFAAPADVATVSAAMAAKLRAAGWRSEGAESWTKPGRKLRLTVRPTAAGSNLRFEF